MAAMAFVIAPHAARLPQVLGVVGAGAARWWIARRAWRTPPWWAMMALIAVAVTAPERGWSLAACSGAKSAVLLIAMICLKILEMRNRRDAIIAIFMGFFLAMTNFLYSQNHPDGGYMFVCVLFVATLIGYNRTASNATWKERIRPAAMICIQAIPMMLVLFFLFHALRPLLWRMPGEDSASTGLSDSMTPGDISNCQSPRPWHFVWISRARCRTTKICIGAGPCWPEHGSHLACSHRHAVAGRYTTGHDATVAARKIPCHAQPHNKPWLFALDLPVDVPQGRDPVCRLPNARSRRRDDLCAFMKFHRRCDFKLEPRFRNVRAAKRVALPRFQSSRAVAYAKQLKAQFPRFQATHRTPDAALFARIRIHVGAPRLAEHPVDEFLFDTKKGFASTTREFVFVLRQRHPIASGHRVPRWRGQPDSRGKLWFANQAHAWAEVWLTTWDG